jgi:hypothetical protein
MEDLSQRKPPQLNIKAEDTTPTGENGALVWSTQEGRLLSYNENAGRYGVVGVDSALEAIKMPPVNYYSFLALITSTTLALAENRQYFLPFYLTEDRSITAMGYNVTTAASSGSAAVGIYNTQVVNGISMPYQLLTSATGMDITSTGIKTATPTPSITLRAGIMYWASILLTANVTVRACAPVTRMLNTFFNSITSVYLNNNTGSLVNPAPTDNYIAQSPTAPLLVYN